MSDTLTGFVKTALRRGITVEAFLTKDETLGFKLSGFYKSGTVELTAEPAYIMARARYNETTRVDTWDDLVRLNHRWWLRYRNRFEGWKHPDSGFVEDFKRLNLGEESDE
jgi:hypothetical protein